MVPKLTKLGLYVVRNYYTSQYSLLGEPSNTRSPGPPKTKNKTKYKTTKGGSLLSTKKCQPLTARPKAKPLEDADRKA